MHETILKTDEIYKGRVVNLVVHEVELPDGQHGKRELVRHPGAVAIVALDPDQNVLLVRQYRIAADRILSEIPAGTLNPGEDPQVCAIRELQEETAYKPGQIEKIGGIFVAPGYTTEFIHLYLATDLSESRLPGDEDEFIEVAVNASHILWVATANDESAIPEPILNRMNVYAIERPDLEGAMRIARALYGEILAAHNWGFDPDGLDDEVLEKLADIPPRDMRKLLLDAFGNAKIEGRNYLMLKDLNLERLGKRKARIGFYS